MNAHTKPQQDKVFQTDFIDSQKSNPSFAHLLPLTHIYIYNTWPHFRGFSQVDTVFALHFADDSTYFFVGLIKKFNKFRESSWQKCQ